MQILIVVGQGDRDADSWNSLWKVGQPKWWLSPAGPSALHQESLLSKDICTQLKAILRAVVWPTLLEFIFGTDFIPFFGLQNEAIPKATLLLAQRSRQEGQPLVWEWQGKARGWEPLQSSYFHLSVTQHYPRPQWPFLCEYSLHGLQIWWIWALWSNLNSWVNSYSLASKFAQEFSRERLCFPHISNATMLKTSD